MLVISDGNMQAYLGSTLSAGDVISFFFSGFEFCLCFSFGKEDNKVKTAIL